LFFNFNKLKFLDEIIGEFFTGYSFLIQQGSLPILMLFFVFSCAGFLGVYCVAALTKRFGAITSAITSTVRKGLTLLLSYVFYPDDKAITIWHVFGGSIFMWALFIRSMSKGDDITNKHEEVSVRKNSKDYTSEKLDDMEKYSTSNKSEMEKYSKSNKSEMEKYNRSENNFKSDFGDNGMFFFQPQQRTPPHKSRANRTVQVV